MSFSYSGESSWQHVTGKVTICVCACHSVPAAFNSLNINTGSDVNIFKSLSVISSGSNSHTHTLSPSLPPHANKRDRPSFKPTPGGMYSGGGEGSLGPLEWGCRLGFFRWEGEECCHAPLWPLYAEYVLYE